jgi:hypothetical protein
LSKIDGRARKDLDLQHRRGQGYLIGHLRVSTPGKESLPQPEMLSLAFDVAKRAIGLIVAIRAGGLQYQLDVSNVGKMGHKANVCVQS